MRTFNKYLTTDLKEAEFKCNFYVCPQEGEMQTRIKIDFEHFYFWILKYSNVLSFMVLQHHKITNIGWIAQKT